MREPIPAEANRSAANGSVPAAGLWLALIVAAGALLRWREAARTPLWFDEIFSLWMVRRPFAALIEYLKGDIHPPLFSTLLWGWRAMRGENPLWLKTLPLLIGLAAIVTLYAAASEWFGRRAGLLAAALLALHAMHVYFSQEVRSYSLLILAILLSTWTAWRWLTRGRVRDGVAYVASAALALYTHYLAGLVLVLLAVAVTFALRRAPRRIALWALWNAAAVAVFAPQIPVFLHQASLSREHWIKTVDPESLQNLSRRITFGSYYMAPVLGAIAVLPLLRRGTRGIAALLWWMGTVPVLLAFFLTWFGAHLFVERYMYFVVPFWMALFAGALAAAPQRRAGAIASLLLVAFAARAIMLQKPSPEPAAQGEVVRELKARIRPGDVIYCADTHSLFVLENELPDQPVRLLLTWTHVPYYEGVVFVRDSLRAFPATVAVRATSARWWAMRTRHGGISSERGAALFDSLAHGGREQVEMVTLWAGKPGMLERR